MKNKKTLWLRFCVAAAVILMVCGCGDKEDKKPPEDPSEKAEQVNVSEDREKTGENKIEVEKSTKKDIQKDTKKDDDKDIVTIRFDSKGGSKVGAFKVKTGAEPRMPSTTREGYQFYYWTDKEGARFYTGVSYTTDELDSDKDGKSDLEAVWEQLVTIRFDTRGGSRVDDMYIRQGESVQLPFWTEKKGYEFGGWKDANGNRIAGGDQIEGSGTVTLYADWIRVVLVHFDSNGGNEIAARTLKGGQEYDDMPVPTREGYWFWGWYYPDGEKLWYTMEDDKVRYSINWESNEVTMTAQWRKTVLINFDTAGGNPLDGLLWVKGEPAALDYPEREGYDFAGWIDPDGNMIENNTIHTDWPGNEITLTAVWAPKGEPDAAKDDHLREGKAVVC